MSTLVTGAAGFIGFHLCKRLIKEGISVIGIDNFNSYYDISLKRAREQELFEAAKEYMGEFKMIEVNLEDDEEIKKIFDEYAPKKVVNLAAQAGVRYSIENPKAYIKSNLVG